MTVKVHGIADASVFPVFQASAVFRRGGKRQEMRKAPAAVSRGSVLPMIFSDSGKG